jgi:hypothetical protein
MVEIDKWGGVILLLRHPDEVSSIFIVVSEAVVVVVIEIASKPTPNAHAGCFMLRPL